MDKKILDSKVICIDTDNIGFIREEEDSHFIEFNSYYDEREEKFFKTIPDPHKYLYILNGRKINEIFIQIDCQKVKVINYPKRPKSIKTFKSHKKLISPVNKMNFKSPERKQKNNPGFFQRLYSNKESPKPKRKNLFYKVENTSNIEGRRRKTSLSNKKRKTSLSNRKRLSSLSNTTTTTPVKNNKDVNGVQIYRKRIYGWLKRNGN